MAFTDPEVLARFDRSYGDKKEELRIDRGEYKGVPTYTLRLYWQATDGTWRWNEQKPTQSGKCWERLNLKQRELEAIGLALIDCARGALSPLVIPPPSPLLAEPQPALAEADLDDIPF